MRAEFDYLKDCGKLTRVSSLLRFRYKTGCFANIVVYVECMYTKMESHYGIYQASST